jgi:Ca2+-binding EF-hand superfamily protein
MKYVILILLLICSLMFFGVSLTGAMHNLFNEMDVNRDGKVSLEEFSKNMERDAFNKLDKNKDGFITPEEWVGTDFIEDKEKGREIFRAMDKNAKKRISFLDFSNYADKYSNIEEAFMVQDKDKDGALSPDEITLRPLFRLITVRY